MLLQLSQSGNNKMKVNPNNDQQLTFKVEKFEGPLDLLLHLIRQNKMDINDIPMAEITSQYIDYLHQMQTLQLDVAGEYLVMASMLLNIKSKMLLPTEPTVTDEFEEEYDDPREELVQQLILHQTFQDAGIQLKSLALERQKKYSREQAPLPEGTQLGKLKDDRLDVGLLQQAFSRILNQRKISQPVKRKLETEKYTIKSEIERVRYRVWNTNCPIEFQQLFDDQVEVEQLVTTFLALLELIKRGEIVVSQALQLGPIILERGKKDAVKPSKG